MTHSLQKPPTPSSTRPWAGAERFAAISLAGLDFVPDLSGALFCPDHAALLVADLHFEKGTSRGHLGRHLPPYDTRSTLAQLAAVLRRRQPRLLIALGDSFHDEAGPGRLDEADRQALAAIATTTETIWITGNHDPALPEDLPGTVVSEVQLGPVVLRHEPQTGAQEEIAGHLHPVATLSQRGRRIRSRCFCADSRRIVMPAFGAYTGGLDVTAPAFAPLFQAGFDAWMIGSSAIRRVPSKRLRG